MDLDLSSVSIDPSQLPAFDASSIQIDPSSMDLSGLSFDLSGLDLSFDGAQPTIDSAAIGTAMAQVMQGFGDWYAQHSGEYADYSEAVSAYFADPTVSQQMRDVIAGAIDTAGMQEGIAEQVQQQVGTAVQQQLVPQIAAALGQAIQQQLQTAIQVYMTQTMTAVMSQMGATLQQQVGAAMEQSMSQLAANMANAMHIDESAFADAFQLNMDEDDLTELMMSMMGSGEATYDGNLASLGYADVGKPSEIAIYPIDFQGKENVLQILDDYNARMEGSGQDDKVITYTDIVGTLMSSVTTIVDMISYVLIAFVAISLVVSSIMIGVITYISVLERRKEIGILRAIGASKSDISHVFNAETVIEGLVAGLLGVGITALGCIPASAIVYAMFDVPNVAQLPWQAAAVLVLISVFLTFVAGLIPASNASRKDPVEALRSE